MTTSQYITIPLTKGYATIVDEIDSDLVKFRWNTCILKTSIYAQRQIKLFDKPKTLTMHRVILSRILGRDLSKGECVDHINGNGLDNRRSNLRLSSYKQNTSNKVKHTLTESGYKGVTLSKRKNRNVFKVVIGVDYKLIYIGCYATPELAAQAYNEAAIKYHGEFARLNIIPKKD